MVSLVWLMQPTQSQSLRWSPAFSVDAQAMSVPSKNWAAGGAPSRLIGIRLCGAGGSTWTAPTRGGELPGRACAASGAGGGDEGSGVSVNGAEYGSGPSDGRACAASDAGGGDGGGGAGVNGAEYGSDPSDSPSKIMGSSAIHASSLMGGRARVGEKLSATVGERGGAGGVTMSSLGIGSGAGDDTSRAPSGGATRGDVALTATP